MHAYLDLLLLRMLKVAVGMSNDKKIKEYFIFTSFCLLNADSAVITSFKQHSAKTICQDLFKLVQEQSP